MKEHLQVAIQIPFNTYRLTEKRVQEAWLYRRLELFYHYTLKSLMSQSDQDFQVLLNEDPSTTPFIHEQLAKRKELPANIHFGTAEENQERLQGWLTKKEKLYLVRLDSDDLYEQTFIERLKHFKMQEDTQAIISTEGYVYSLLNGKLTAYHRQSPPFYTLIYRAATYNKGQYYQLSGHQSVVSRLKCEVLPGRNFMITLNETNTSSGEWIRGMRMAYEEEEKRQILKRFGLS